MYYIALKFCLIVVEGHGRSYHRARGARAPPSAA